MSFKQMVRYEWDVEIIHIGDTAGLEDGEILDHRHCDTYAEARKVAALVPRDGERAEVVLVRDGLTASGEGDDRHWAYVVGSALPDKFADAMNVPRIPVPKKFHAEVARWHNCRTERQP